VKRESRELNNSCRSGTLQFLIQHPGVKARLYIETTISKLTCGAPEQQLRLAADQESTQTCGKIIVRNLLLTELQSIFTIRTSNAGLWRPAANWV